MANSTSKDEYKQARDALVAEYTEVLPKVDLSRPVCDQVSDDEALIVLVVMLNTEVENGGFKQWLLNPPSINWKDTERLLREIDEDLVADLVLRAAACFGPAGPSPDLLRRQEQYRGMPVESRHTLNRLGDEYYRVQREFIVRVERVVSQTRPDDAERGDQ